MNGYEITILMLMGIGLLLKAYLHGEERTGKFSAPLAMLRSGVTLFLMYKAGLFQIFS